MNKINFEIESIYHLDNLLVMRGINRSTIDTIYMDPPFNSNRNYQCFPEDRDAVEAFKDIFIWNEEKEDLLTEISKKYDSLSYFLKAIPIKKTKAYCVYMAARMIEAYELLKPTGTLWFHNDKSANHYNKLMLDFIFGESNFRDEIYWQRRVASKSPTKSLPTMNDIILRYTKSDKFTWNKDAVAIRYDLENLDPKTLKNYPKIEFESNRLYKLEAVDLGYKVDKKTEERLTYEILGVTRLWRYPENTMREKIDAGIVYIPVGCTVPREKKYLDEQTRISNIWTDIPGVEKISKNERTGYQTQKPLTLLERIIQASTIEGDIVLDPFCGTGTTCIAAELKNRKWFGIDVGKATADIIKDRFTFEDPRYHKEKVPIIETPPVRTDKATKKNLSEKDLFKDKLYGKQLGDCNGCRNFYLYKDLTLDHVKPESQGGANELKNLQLLCGHCNSTKGNRSQEYLINRLIELGIREK